MYFQFTRILTNSTKPEVNNYVNFQQLSYKQPHI